MGEGRRSEQVHVQYYSCSKNCRELWRQAGEAGMLGVTVPEEFGGAGLDILYSSVHWEEQAYAGATGPVRKRN